MDVFDTFLDAPAPARSISSHSWKQSNAGTAALMASNNALIASNVDSGTTSGGKNASAILGACSASSLGPRKCVPTAGGLLRGGEPSLPAVREEDLLVPSVPCKKNDSTPSGCSSPPRSRPNRRDSPARFPRPRSSRSSTVLGGGQAYPPPPSLVTPPNTLQSIFHNASRMRGVSCSSRGRTISSCSPLEILPRRSRRSCSPSARSSCKREANSSLSRGRPPRRGGGKRAVIVCSFSWSWGGASSVGAFCEDEGEDHSWEQSRPRPNEGLSGRGGGSFSAPSGRLAGSYPGSGDEDR